MSLLQELVEEGYTHSRANVDDLVLFVNNNEGLRSESFAIVKRCGKKYIVSCWKRFADKVAKAYANEHNDPTLWNRIFSVADRKKATKELFQQAKTDYQDHLNYKTSEKEEEMAMAREYDRSNMLGIHPEQEEVDIGAEETYGSHDSHYDHGNDDTHLDKDHDYVEPEKKRGRPKFNSALANSFIIGRK